MGRQAHDILALTQFMKKFLRPMFMIGFGLLLAIACAGIGATIPASSNSLTGSIFLQATATPQPKQISVVGSTDGIVAMGFIIVLIIVIPILIRRKSWMR
jgi:hypothetical protein